MMKKYYIVALIIFLLIFIIPCEGKVQADDIKNLAAPEVKNIFDNHAALLIHVLSEIEFKIQHIPGSINIPIVHMKSTDKLPMEKDKPLIFYCMGVR